MRSSKLSIIVLSYNTRDLLRKCLESIPSGLEDCGQDFKISDYEVVVIDNASSDGSADMVKNEFPSIALLCNSMNEGFARAINRATAVCQGEFILVSNSDVIYPPGSIARMVQYAMTHPTAGIVGPQLVYPDGSWQRSYGGYPSVRTMLSRILLFESGVNIVKRMLWPKVLVDRYPKPVPYVDGAAMLVRKTLFDYLQGFDESFFFYAEDADLCFRAWQAGSRVVFLPSVHVVHVRGGTTSKKPSDAVSKLWLKSNVHFVKKWGGNKQAVNFIKLNRLYFLERWLLARISCRKKEAERWYCLYQITKDVQIQ